MNNLVSRAMASNLIIKAICGEKEPRQKVGESYSIPPMPTRRLLARLIVEETIETVQGLGCGYLLGGEKEEVMRLLTEPNCSPDLEKTIDGSCDLQFVAIGALAACGVPDLPHMTEVCGANERKFPGGVGIFDENGKYQKPNNWMGPQHGLVARCFDRTPSLKDHSVFLLDCFQKGILIE